MVSRTAAYTAVSLTVTAMSILSQRLKSLQRQPKTSGIGDTFQVSRTTAYTAVSLTDTAMSILSQQLTSLQCQPKAPGIGDSFMVSRTQVCCFFSCARHVYLRR